MANNVEYVLSLRDLLTGKLNDANAAANRLETTMSGVQSILGALGVAGGIAGIVAFGKSVVDAGTKVEDARVGLTTLLKDANEAGKVIQNTMTDAAKTPFSFEGLLAANKALISAGADSQTARKDVLNLANAIAATGGSNEELQRMVVNLQQIKNTGKATALDIKQFAYAGVNLYAALDAAGISYAKGQELTYEQITQALQKAHEAGGIYYNGLENMANNTSIQISNLGDAMFQLSVKIFDNLKPAIDGVVGALQGGIKFVSEHGKEMKALGLAVGIGAVAWGTYKTAVGLATVAQWALNAAIEANPIVWIVTGIAAAAAAFYYAYEKLEWFRGAIWAVGAMIKEYVNLWIDLFKGFGLVIKGAFDLDYKEIESGLGKITSVYKDGFTRIGKAAKEGYNAGVANFFEQQNKESEGVGMNLGYHPFSMLNKPTPGKPTAKPTTEAGASVSPKGATASRAVTINISINKMIETFKINTTNLQESASKVHEAVSNAMLQAINDSQIVGNI